MMNKKKNNKRMKKKSFFKDHRTYLMIILFVPVILLLAQLIYLDVLPMKYLIPAGIVLLLLVILMWWLQYSKKISKINRVLGKALLILLSAIMIVGNLYIYQTLSTMGKVSVNEGDTEYEVMSVIVEQESKAKKLKDIKDEVIAIPEKIDLENMDRTIKDINKQLDKTMETKTYINTNEQAGGLLTGEVGAMVLNEAYRSLLDENYPDFAQKTKVIYEYKIPKKVKKLGSAVDVTKEPYNVYISGIDTYGDIGTKSRSDVNMIATVNPLTNQILLTSIPRDYYIQQPCQGNQADKLTHTGIFGVECTIDSMQVFTGLTLNYYARVNFSSVEEIVDAIGGIDVYNQLGFYSGVDSSYIPEGQLHMNGNTALKFSRERHAYADGDRQRGRNQMIVLNAIIDKAISPAILTQYSSIMSAVGNSFQTNMKSSEMSAIVKMQLDNASGWNIVQQSLTGSGGLDWTPANGFEAYVMYPDQTSVDTALQNIDKVIKGEILAKIE